MSFPTCDTDFGAFAGFRDDRKFVAEPLGAAEAEPHALAGGEAVLERLFDIGNAGAPVPEGEAHAAAAALFDESGCHFAAAAVIQRVARQFAGGGDDLGLVD